MIQLSGIFSESLGGTCTIRGYAKYNEIVELSYPHPGYQRPAEDEHVAEISSFITSGSNSFSPEVVLAYTAKYNYYAQGAKTQLKVYLKQRIDAAKNKNNNGVVVYPTKQPYEELDQVGYWCLLNVLKAKDFQEFLGNSEAFDFYCEYAKFDFSRFDVSWLLNLYPHTLEQIAKNAKVKERVRVAIATTLDGEAIAPSDSQRLQSILVKHFC